MWGGKNISLRRTGFPRSRPRDGSDVGVQGPGEFQAEEMIVVQMCDPHSPGANGARGGTDTVGWADGRAGDLQRDHSGLVEGAPDHNQRATGGDVYGGGKLQRILAVILATTDKYRNGELQPRPLSPLSLRGVRSQSAPTGKQGLEQGKCRRLGAKPGKDRIQGPSPAKPRTQYGNYTALVFYRIWNQLPQNAVKCNSFRFRAGLGAFVIDSPMYLT